jgi:hypothetical protein
VERDGNRVRLITRGGYDWTKRYPWIVEAALKNRQKRFVIDGEAVILGVDGISDFDALHSGRHNGEVQLCAFATSAQDGKCPSQCRRPISRGYSLAGAMASSSRPVRPARSAPTYSAPRARWDLRAWSASTAIAPIEAAHASTVVVGAVDQDALHAHVMHLWVKVKNPDSSAMKRAAEVDRSR